MGLDPRAGSNVGSFDENRMYVLPAKGLVSHAHSSLAFKGENALVELAPEVDLGQLDKALYLCGRRLNLVDWKESGFSTC